MQKELKKCLNEEIIVLCICKGEVKCLSGILHQVKEKSLTIANKENIGDIHRQRWIDQFQTIQYSDIERVSTGKKVL